MRKIAEKVKLKIESEGLYNVECIDLDDLRYGKSGPIYSAI